MYFNYDLEPRTDYLCIDCRSFYASCEAVMRGLHPLETMLVVLSGADRPGGLVLSASPKAKEVLGISNVTRSYDVPKHKDLVIAPPRMYEYIKINMLILETIQKYVPAEDVHVYSIDELFIRYQNVKRLYNNADVKLFARALMKKIFEATGIYTATGIGDNMLLAKLPLDNEAKKNADSIAIWRYEDVPSKVWGIKKMTDFWGIGSRTEKNLKGKGIMTIEELANYDPYRLKKSMGLIGAQLHAHANGIDRSQIGQEYKPVEKSLSNSQILLKDYDDPRDIKVIIREMSELIAARVRHIGAQTSTIGLFIGYSKIECIHGFSKQMKILPTNNSKVITSYMLKIFEDNYRPGLFVRHIGVSCSHFSYDTHIQLSLFDDIDQQIKQAKIDILTDKIREKFGFAAIIHASSLLENATAVSRSQKIGGH
ncbi:Y-family DNA polymerase [Enterococcus alcedinis]|uniref:Excinuclease ABC subunit A n=2 Tax=Enterococcus alcedinis TaxID=1274384 RepID=A0A917JEZ7_9ENTE|nr:Y-family DNA polymerase [Enterococcus alcedinis]GGI64755.1 excinuclease ABC subunit A [Enterococcus alcedinis]